jgi:hypothetical protein
MHSFHANDANPTSTLLIATVNAEALVDSDSTVRLAETDRLADLVGAAEAGVPVEDWEGAVLEPVGGTLYGATDEPSAR